jgi:Protein of unknown function (DUF732)
MRDRETIDSELRLLAAARRSIREHGGELSSRQIDELLDERLGHRAEASATEAGEARQTEVVAHTWSQRSETDRRTPYGRKGVLRRFGLLAALPLSLVAVATVLVMMFAVRNPDPAAQPTVVPPSGARPNPAQPTGVPPSGARPNPAQPTGVPPSGARPNPAAPKAHVPPVEIVDRAFIDVLKQEGVPIPSHEYVLSHGHAVCDFLAHQPNFAEAVRFVQQSSVWDANQSTDVAIGAIVSYCPQYEIASPDQMQQPLQNALSDLQAIQGDLQGIRDGLQDIPGQH